MKPRHGLLQFRNFVVLHNLLDREIIESLILIFLFPLSAEPVWHYAPGKYGNRYWDR